MTEAEKIAFTDGFAAAWETRVNGNDRENPYDREVDPRLFHKWQEGFDRYMESLL